MKALKYFIFLLLMAMPSEMVVAQNYVIPIGRRYIMRRYNPMVYPLYGDQILYYDAIGDTVIDGNLYKILRYNNDEDNYIRWNGKKCVRYYPEKGRYTLVFDESWQVGDATTISDLNGNGLLRVIEISELQGRKLWNVGNSQQLWLQGVGGLWHPIFDLDFNTPNSWANVLICCVEANGDTLYVDRDNLHLIQTGISSLTSDNLTISLTAGGLSVDLDAAADWSATLYNSNGVTVAQQQGNGSEIFLPTDGKGTHILVVKAGGKVVKKKVLLR